MRVEKELEEFTCDIYGHKTLKSVNAARTKMIKKMAGGDTTTLKSVKKVDLARLPPCQRSLSPHIRRVNYRLAQWKRAHLPLDHVPVPDESHGWTTVDGILEPLWSDGPVLPPSLHEFVGPKDTDDDDSEDDSWSLDGSHYSSSSESDIPVVIGGFRKNETDSVASI